MFIEQFSHSSYIPKVKLTQFRLATRTGQTKLVKSLGYPLWEGRVSKSDEIRWSAGILLAAYLVSIGDLEEGLGIYRGLFQRAKSRGRQLDILWRAGVAAIRANQNERARTNLLGVLRRNPGSTMDSAARFWLAIANNRLGRRVDALRTLIKLEQQKPFHYYGIRAHKWIVRESIQEETELIQRLREKSSPSKLEFPPLRLNNSTQRHPYFVASTYLARAGLKVEAAQYARRALRENHKDSALALLTARASASAGEHRYSLSILANYFGQFLQRPTKNLPEDFWRLAYPRPFFDDIKNVATTHNVDPLLLVSLMRQESRFDKQAESSVGAIGLFQIMPYTAAELAPELGLSIPDDIALMEPSINSALAGALLSRLNLEFSGATPPIVASYNAGEERVHAWWKAARHVPLELFVDTIPYSETRGFVREVLTNYNEYKRLYPTRP
jgi:soluble lytic murein transglycosylase